MICKKLKEQFKSRADTFDDSARWVTDKGLLAIHRKFAGVSCGDRILEACCGTGVVGKTLCDNGLTVVGLDLSPDMLNKAKDRLRYCVNGRMEHLPFPDDVFDILVCRQALHFLALEKAAKEMFRVIKRGKGRIVISQIVPFGSRDSGWLYEIHRRKQPSLLNFLHEQDIRDLLRGAGFLDITSQEYLLEEPINSWLKDTYFAQPVIEEIKKMFVNAPAGYKALHHTRVTGEEIFDTMRWVVFGGKKT